MYTFSCVDASAGAYMDIYMKDRNQHCLLSPYFNIIVIITVVSIIVMIMIICFPHFLSVLCEFFTMCFDYIHLATPTHPRFNSASPHTQFCVFFVSLFWNPLNQLVLFMYIAGYVTFQNFVAKLFGAKCLEKINSPSPSSYQLPIEVIFHVHLSSMCWRFCLA